MPNEEKIVFWWTAERIIAAGSLLVAILFAFLFFSERSDARTGTELANRASRVGEACLVRYWDAIDTTGAKADALRTAFEELVDDER